MVEPPGGDSPEGPAGSLSVATADIDYCFHRLIMPEWMSAYFAYPSVSGWESGFEGRLLDGVAVNAGEVLFPCGWALPMGFSWSLHLAHRANERQCSDLQ